MTRRRKNSFKLALLCGGPSLERGISLNSARSVCDHLHSDTIEVEPIYFNHKREAFAISRSQLYSNTPSDFDFKLKTTAKPLSKSALARTLKATDIAFPAMHGPFGEDGRVQQLLEKMNCPYVGSSAAACKLMFDKFVANNHIAEHDFHTLPSELLLRGDETNRKRLSAFFRKHKIERAIVKPATGGSSIAVYSVSTVKEALEMAEEIFRGRVDGRVVVEPFCTGTEFTVIILQNRFGMPVAILPTEIEIDYSEHQIFDYRKKYLATRQVTYHCPPRFDNDVIERIQIQAEQLFTLFGMRDFARIDGWLLPDGNLWFSDFNPISGMEQNSFLFMQAARVGMSHRDALRFVVEAACNRSGIAFPEEQNGVGKKRKQVNVIFGGKTAERQVSLMSGTNVWLKLRRSKYDPKPYLLDKDHNVWRLPYGFALNHTVEEIHDMCRTARKDAARLKTLITRVIDRLAAPESARTEPWFVPEKTSLQEFIKSSDYIFVGLHGGIGEDGTLQKMLEDARVPFSASGSAASKLCMDKYATGLALAPLASEGIYTAAKKRVGLRVFSGFKLRDYHHYWNELLEQLETKTVIVKPVDDGCSAGVARLFSAKDLKQYITYASRGAAAIPPECLTDQHGIIEMPTEAMKNVLFEEFVETDRVRVIGDKLKWQTTTNWIEVTVGILEQGGKIHALSPSITVAIGNVLSLEEKFQGGTGINITPPPQPHVSSHAVRKAKERIVRIAKTLGLRNYARIDCFLEVKTGELIVIEVNTTPGLTASTVIYHQALAEKPPLYPVQFLEKIVDSSRRAR